MPTDSGYGTESVIAYITDPGPKPAPPKRYTFRVYHVKEGPVQYTIHGCQYCGQMPKVEPHETGFGISVSGYLVWCPHKNCKWSISVHDKVFSSKGMASAITHWNKKNSRESTQEHITYLRQEYASAMKKWAEQKRRFHGTLTVKET